MIVFPLPGVGTSPLGGDRPPWFPPFPRSRANPLLPSFSSLLLAIDTSPRPSAPLPHCLFGVPSNSHTGFLYWSRPRNTHLPGLFPPWFPLERVRLRAFPPFFPPALLLYFTPWPVRVLLRAHTQSPPPSPFVRALPLRAAAAFSDVLPEALDDFPGLS